MSAAKFISRTLVVVCFVLIGEAALPAFASPPIQDCTFDDGQKADLWLADLSITDAWLLKEQCRVELKKTPLDPQKLYAMAIAQLATGEVARGRLLLGSLRDEVPQAAADITGLDVRAARGKSEFAQSTSNLRQLVQDGVPKARYVLAKLIAEGKVDPTSDDELTDLLSGDLAEGSELAANLVAEAYIKNIAVEEKYALGALGVLKQCAVRSIRCAYHYVQASRRTGSPIDRALLSESELTFSFSRDPREAYWFAFLREGKWIALGNSDAIAALYLMSAEAGNTAAIMRVSQMAYGCSPHPENIVGRKKDAMNWRCAEAAAWLLEQSSKGNGYAQMKIGQAYLTNSSSELFRRNDDEARHWLERAMENGVPEALFFVPDAGKASQ